MHEMSLMRDVVDVVVEQAERVHAKGVRRVHLTIGDGRDVIMDLVDSLFEFLTRDTVAHGAELVITRVPYTVKCNECGMVFPLDVRKPDTWVCPRCSAQNYHLNSGNEFTINRIEVVGSDAPTLEEVRAQARKAQDHPDAGEKSAEQASAAGE